MSKTLNTHAELLEDIRQDEVRLAELYEKANNFVPASYSVVSKEQPLGCVRCTRVQCPLECEHLIETTQPSDQWTTVIQKLFHLTQNYETMPVVALSLKLAEETGKFSKHMLYELGYLPHKTDKVWKDTPAEEAAYIINVLISALSAHYPLKSPELLTAMEVKGKNMQEITKPPTYLLDDIEVVLTGRTAHRTLRNAKINEKVEVTPANKEQCSWTKWVNITELFEIVPPDAKK